MNIRAIPAALLIGLALMLTGGCGSNGGTDSDLTSVDILDNSFASATITVDAGSRVRWTNRGVAVHDVTQQDGAFSSGALSAGQSFTWKATEGTYRYSCTRHGGMSATVIAE